MNVGIVSPGDMGCRMARALMQGGVAVRASLAGRSERTRALAREAGIADSGTLADLMRASDIVLSIVVPEQAVAAARDVARAMGESGRRPVYVDCNAIAPATAREIDGIVGGIVDACILGTGRTGIMRLFVSGAPLAALPGVTLVPVDGPVGAASALKMCWSATSKGLQALWMESLVAARMLGVEEPYRRELASRVSEFEPQLKRLPAVAHRFAGEMEQVARTFSDAGLPPDMLDGAVEVFRLVASSPIGSERPETLDRSRDVWATVGAVAKHADGRS